MRSNGLTASAYTPVADLDPRVAEALLGELKAQGVAAYTKPVESSSVSGFDRPEFRVNVQDRLYVDAAAADRVKAMIAADDPDVVTSSDDLTWAQIVAGFDQPLRGDVHPWPVTEDLDTDTQQAQQAQQDRESAGDDEDLDRSEAGERREAPQPPEERFVPEPPPPLPQLEPWQQLAWVGVIGGPLLLLVSVLFSLTLPTWASLLAITGFIGGFVTLVARMGGGGDSEDDPDNGAVV